MCRIFYGFENVDDFRCVGLALSSSAPAGLPLTFLKAASSSDWLCTDCCLAAVVFRLVSDRTEPVSWASSKVSYLATSSQLRGSPPYILAMGGIEPGRVTRPGAPPTLQEGDCQCRVPFPCPN